MKIFSFSAFFIFCGLAPLLARADIYGEDLVYPVNANHPFEVSGFDNQNRQYTLTIKTSHKNDDVFEVAYALKRGEADQTGTITVKKGKLAALSEKPASSLASPIEFEVKISE
jgi:hypothetical protein